MDRVRDSLPVSLQLMVYAQVLALIIAIPAGVITAYKAGTRRQGGQRHRVRHAGHPEPRSALVLAYYVGVELGWLPVSGA